VSIDKAALLARRLPERDVELAGIGSVRVRGLSRAESLDIPELSGAAREATIIARGLVDPVLSVAEVQAWMAAAPAGEFEVVSTAIGQLSGLLETSGTDAYKSVRGEPGLGV
jgi:hypothetical protein